MPGMSAPPSHHLPGPREGPDWLKSLLRGTFFSPCLVHVAAHKNERNFFCTDCSGSPLCTLCVQKSHPPSLHSTMQIRRSSYHEAVRCTDVQRLLDISGIQVYVINSAKIVFLNGRPQARPQKGAPYSCETCLRTLLDSCRFCSIGCKLGAVETDESVNLMPRGSTGGGQGNLAGAGGALPHASGNCGISVHCGNSGNCGNSVHSVQFGQSGPFGQAGGQRVVAGFMGEGEREGEGEGEESGDSGEGGGERCGGKRRESWRKRSPMPPLIVDDGGDSGGECSQGSENGGRERGREGGQNENEDFFGQQLYGQFRKKRRTAVKVVEDVFLGGKGNNHIEPSSPTSSVLRPETPPQFGVLGLFQWKEGGHRRKGVPQRAPLW